MARGTAGRSVPFVTMFVGAFVLGACGGGAAGVDAGLDGGGLEQDARPSDDAPADAPAADAATDAERVRTSIPGPTGVACPPGSTLRYEEFGRDFASTYCTSCHASTRTGSARNGAPIGFDFDTVEGIRLRRDRIDAVAGAGPTRINTFMPLASPAPSDEEREQLAEWLACGAP